jgi:hypothetical protein
VSKDHIHSWVIIDYIQYADTDNTYRLATTFRPMVSNVARIQAITLCCPDCGKLVSLGEGDDNPVER